MQQQAEEFKNQGNLQFKNNQFKEAINSYQKAIDLFSSKLNQLSTEEKELVAALYNNQCAAYMGLKQSGNALEKVKLALSLKPNWEKAQQRFVQILESQRKFKEAIEYIKQQPNSTTWNEQLQNLETKRYGAINTLFGGKDTMLVNQNGQSFKAGDVLQDKNIALYFSASWCPPCQQFTPMLVEAYEELKENYNNHNLEVVFVSSDQSEAEMMKYMKHKGMSWYALPFADQRRKQSLAQRFSISGIPALIVCGNDGSVITTNGRGDVMQRGHMALLSWAA